jgi:hypothetical protein
MSGKRILVSVAKHDELRANGIPLSPATLRKWHSTGKYKHIFIKLGGMLCVDLGRYHELLEDIEKEAERKEKKIDCMIKKFRA